MCCKKLLDLHLKKSGVALIIDQKRTSRNTNYSFVNDCIITVRLKTNRGHITIVVVYAPEEGTEEETRLSTNYKKKLTNKIRVTV